MKQSDSSIEAIAVINNAISAQLTRRLLEADGIPLERVALILGREIDADWAGQCGQVLCYRGKPRQGVLEQWKHLGYFWRGSRLIRKARNEGRLKAIYLVNNDNLLTNPFFVWAESSNWRLPAITVVGEGIMNYQHIDVRDRAWWRWLLKPVVALLLGIRYRIPRGHLSGAFEAGVGRVVSFTPHGLKAPPEKVVTLPFERAPVNRVPDKKVCLVVHTGLWQWMDEASYLELAQRFVQWLKEQEFTRIITKPHPHVATGIIESLLSDSRSIESMAAEIPALTVVGTCCTALVTLKLIRPDLRCVDYGSDIYCDHAYHGDRGVIALFNGTGVEAVSAYQGTNTPNSCGPVHPNESVCAAVAQ
jgi:hypothetical protein